jgi:hypothetical protein
VENPREGAAASDHEYATHVHDIDASTPARFNADPRRLFEAFGSAGKVMTFAVPSRKHARFWRSVSRMAAACISNAPMNR